MKKGVLVLNLVIVAIFIFTITILFTKPVVILKDELAYVEIQLDDNTNLIDELKQQYNNTDIVGTISITDTLVEGIIAQSTDNSYYLNYNLYKKRDYKGSLFLDYRIDILSSKKLLIYGHMSYSDATPFAHLKNYLDEDYFNKYNELILTTNNGKEVYKVFGVTIYSRNFDYLETDFDNKIDYLDNINSYIKKSLYYDGYEFNGNEKTIFLQTCYPHKKGSYIVVGARKI